MRHFVAALLALSCPCVAVDGDTFRTADHQRVRLRGVDAVEICEPGGLEARQLLQALLNRGNVVIVPKARDKYGRIVAEVTANGVSVEDVIKGRGLARRRGTPRPKCPLVDYRDLVDTPLPMR